MEVPENNLERLLAALLEGVGKHVNPDVSLEQYTVVCKHIAKFVATEGSDTYSQEMLTRYLASIDEKLRSGDISFGYHRFQKRVVRMLCSLIETGQIDLSQALINSDKYPCPVRQFGAVDSVG